MDAEQIATLRAALLADTDPAVAAAVAARNDTEVTRLYNLPTATVIWRSSVTQDEIMQNGFDWVLVDNLTVGKARIWEWLFGNDQKSINPQKTNVRAGIAECWKGTAAMVAVRDAVYAHCKRFATKTETLFLLSGAGTTVDPALPGFEGEVTTNDIGTALNG